MQNCWEKLEVSLRNKNCYLTIDDGKIIVNMQEISPNYDDEIIAVEPHKNNRLHIYRHPVYNHGKKQAVDDVIATVKKCI